MKAEDQLVELKILLPHPPQPKGSYRGCVRAGNLVYISGQGPAVDGKPVYLGKIGQDLEVKDGYESARICGINLLAQLKEFLGSLNKIQRVVSIHGFVNSAPDFYNQPAVIDGTSDLMLQVFGEEKGIHSRCAIGVASLPGNIATEVEMVVEVSG